MRDQGRHQQVGFGDAEGARQVEFAEVEVVAYGLFAGDVGAADGLAGVGEVHSFAGGPGDGHVGGCLGGCGGGLCRKVSDGGGC